MEALKEVVETTEKESIQTVTTVSLPIPKIKTRPYDPEREQESLQAGLSPIIARIIASRPLDPGSDILKALSPKLQQLSMPYTMKDMDRASERIACAILQGEIIGIETDHDCDGQTSHAVLYYNLVQRFKHPPEKIRSYIGHRLKEGYGLSLGVAKRILNDTPRPSLVITADNGSSDEERIALLKAENIDVIVSDHHALPKEGCPNSAFACLNPTRPDCDYGDPYIAGCMVAWLLMAATRQALINAGYLPEDVPSLLDSLDYVAVGTVADCVSMARSINNRAVVSYGLRLIEQGKKPCWRQLTQRSFFSNPPRSEDLGFKLGPLLNSDGRLSTAFGSVSLLLAETEEEAVEWIVALQQQNEQRKNIQREIIQKTIVLAQEQAEAGYVSLSLYLEAGHTGVQGIAASRIKDLFGRPTAIFAKKPGMEGIITGSVRGIEGFHVREALQCVANRDPDLLLAFGGHQGAGGLTLSLNKFARFQQLFEEAARVQCTDSDIYPVIWTEGILKSQDLSLNLIDELKILEPFGREFEPPVFELNAELKEIRAVGDGTHLRVILKIDQKSYAGIWFSARQSANDPLPIVSNKKVKAAVSLRENFFRNERKLDLQIVHMHILDDA